MIRLGVIGCGIMARAFAPAFKSLIADVTPTAMVDIDRSRADAAVALYPTARAFTDYREALAHADAFIIALPHDLHYEVAAACLRAGKHLLLEKPICNTEAECLDLIRIHDASKAVLSIGYVMRYDPLWTQMGEFIRGGAAGSAGPAGDIFQVSIWTEQLTLASRAWGDETHDGRGRCVRPLHQDRRNPDHQRPHRAAKPARGLAVVRRGTSRCCCGPARVGIG